MARAGDLVVVFNISFNLVTDIDDSVVVCRYSQCMFGGNEMSASVCFEILQRVRQFIPLGYELQRSVAITEQGWSDRMEQANISRSERVNTNKQVGTCGSEDLIEAN